MPWMDPSDAVGALKTIVGAGVGAAVVQVLVPLWRDRHQRKAQAAYMAMRLAITLEAYTSACLELIYSNENAEHPPEDRFPNWDVGLPTLPHYPDDAEGWKAIDRRLAGDCLNFRNKIRESQSYISSVINWSEEDLEYEIDIQPGKRGLEAWRLALRLRAKHGLEPADVEWPYADELQAKLEKAEAKERKRRQDSADVMRDMVAGAPKSPS